MAEAEKHEEVRVTEEYVTLKLSMAEARALYAMTIRVGGSPGIESPRGLVDDIRNALRAACGDQSFTRDQWASPENELFGGSIIAADYPVDADKW